MKHYNPSITERANRIFNLKNGDGMSDEIDGPVAVIPITPSVKIIKTASSGTVYATPTDKDFYLASATLSFAKTAADTGTDCFLSVTIDGVSQSIIRIRGITLTADSQTVVMPLPIPIKVDRGTNITIGTTGTYTITGATIQGYIEEVTRT